MKKKILICLFLVLIMGALNCGKKAPPQPVRKESAERESTRIKDLVSAISPLTLNVEALEKIPVLVSR